MKNLMWKGKGSKKCQVYPGAGSLSISFVKLLWNLEIKKFKHI